MKKRWRGCLTPLLACVLAGPLTAQGVAIEDGVVYEGQESYRITTRSATYVYHQEGGGLASLKDRDGVEWIGYRPGGGSAGEFRGIPNFGAFGHPGYTGEKGSKSRVAERTAEKVTVWTEGAVWASPGRGICRTRSGCTSRGRRCGVRCFWPSTMGTVRVINTGRWKAT
jgi:hypothetical protein